LENEVMSVSNPTHKDRTVWERNANARAARSETELVGVVQDVKFYDSASGAIIAQMRSGEIVKGECEDGEIEPGIAFRFLGGWVAHHRWGQQFAFRSFVLHTPASENGVRKYLATLCRGVGGVIAGRLWDAYHEAAVEVLRTDPARVVADGIMREDVAHEAARDLVANAAMEATKLDLYALFDGRGFPRRLIRDVIARWGVRAAQKVKASPFRLLVEDFSGCGFKRCDKLYLDLGHDPHALKRQMLAAWNALHEDTDGSTWLSRGVAVRAIRGCVGDTHARPDDAIALGVRSRWLAVCERDGAKYVAEAGNARAERELAAKVAALQAFNGSSGDLWPLAEHLDSRVSDHQRQAATECLDAPVCVLNGSPGTGKTFLAAAVIRAVIAEHGHDCVAVAAPTGKAAVRITAAMHSYGIDLHATTIHRLLEIGRNGHDGKGWGFVRRADNPLPQRFLFVDEASMLDTNLAASLFAACAPGTHVLLIGDTGQLSPVGHGCPLRDLIASGRVPIGELSEIQRNAGMIVRACADIKAGRRFETCVKYDALAGHNLKLVECDTPAAQVEALRTVLGAFRASGKFDPVADVQVLVAVNEKSMVSRVALNTMLQGMLNPPHENDATEAGSGRDAHADREQDADGASTLPAAWRVSDKLICLRNCWVEGAVLPGGEDMACVTDAAGWAVEYDGMNAGPVQHFLANGDQGRVLATGHGVLIAEFVGPRRCVRVPVSVKAATTGDAGSKGGSAGDFSLAYAITGHKSQGSEYPVAIVMVDDNAGFVASREHVYTCISRASKLCILIGKRATIDRQVRRVSLTRRKTFLTALLQEGGGVAP
jgi:exodeoxyribonuclease V alpha subunit